MRDAVHAVLVHLAAPFGVVDVEHDEVDVVAESALDVEDVRGGFLAHLAPVGVKLHDGGSAVGEGDVEGDGVLLEGGEGRGAAAEPAHEERDAQRESRARDRLAVVGGLLGGGRGRGRGGVLGLRAEDVRGDAARRDRPGDRARRRRGREPDAARDRPGFGRNRGDSPDGGGPGGHRAGDARARPDRTRRGVRGEHAQMDARRTTNVDSSEARGGVRATSTWNWTMSRRYGKKFYLGTPNAFRVGHGF